MIYKSPVSCAIHKTDTQTKVTEKKSRLRISYESDESPITKETTSQK